ncbi:hypothetical protein BLA29_000035 [Euroglyphus maynei]|uniref:Uncharacterized protein n=1 Tax=Euroglyphus maynei TaxID=6958 RepID=A0A1Y3ARM9_EURMA|nr:hypothetical protein BLA29_000035 [Euroglyphus maynei]
MACCSGAVSRVLGDFLLRLARIEGRIEGDVPAAAGDATQRGAVKLVFLHSGIDRRCTAHRCAEAFHVRRRDFDGAEDVAADRERPCLKLLRGILLARHPHLQFTGAGTQYRQFGAGFHRVLAAPILA